MNFDMTHTFLLHPPGLILFIRPYTLTQTEVVRRLPSHPLHCKLAAPSKNRLKRKSLNHLTKELRKKDDDILDKEIDSENYLTLKNWNSTSNPHTIELEIPGLSSRQEQNPALEKIMTLELLEQKYPPEVWTQIYTDISAQNAVKNGGNGVYIRTPDGNTQTYSDATGTRCSHFKAKVCALQTAVTHIKTSQPEKSVVLTDSKAALQSLGSDSPDKDLHSIPAQCTIVLQWIPAHCGIAGNEEADKLAKSGSEKTHPNPSTTYKEAKTLLKNKRKSEWRRTT